MKALKRLSNISKYGLGAQGRERKQADKEQRRQQRFHDADVWEHSEDGARRKYSSYEEYIEHQASKLDKIMPPAARKGGRGLRRIQAALCQLRRARRRAGSALPWRAARHRRRALHDLGYFAIGIDLNPGERNPYVLPGDYRVVFPSGSIDAVYTNALDHVFSLEELVGEVQRLLRPGGVFVADLELGSEEGFIPGEYEAAMWRDHRRLIGQIKDLGRFEVEQVRDLGKSRRDQWTQVVFRKPA